MKLPLLIAAAVMGLAATWPASAQPVTVDDFLKDLMGVPLCGTPESGPLSGKTLCTVHLSDGTAVVAGSGILVRGVWEAADGRICRRNPEDPLERRRCVNYERIGEGRYRNSDGVEVCVGPCP